MRNKGGVFLQGFALWLVLVLFLSPALAQTVNARFSAGSQITWPIAYSDAYFARSGREYHHDTALSSLGMALSAFRSKEPDLKLKGSNIRAYLESMGFQDISLTQYDIEPSVRTIATAMGHKTIATLQGKAQVVAVAVSGGGYQDEWKSNFSIGNSTHHEGFDQAAWQVVDRLIRYTKAYKLDNAKIWISGYSRAAATANRTAAILQDKKLVTPDNLYAYTFATPNNTKQEGAQNYPSIFNVVGSFDPVPMVPFADWGFTRYGQTFFLPAAEINSDYAQRAVPVRLSYSRMTGTEFWSNSSSNSVLQKMLGAITESVPDTQSYQSNMQSFMLNLWNNRNDPLKALMGTAREIYQAPDFRGAMQDLGNKMLSIFSNATQEKMMQESGMLKDEWRNAGGLTDNLVHEHMPTVYLSWMSAYPNGQGLFTPAATYRQVRVTLASSLRVLNEKGEVAASYSGQGSQNTGVLPMSMSGEELVVTVPADKPYQVVLERGNLDATTLYIREGVAGRTRMQSYQAKEENLRGASSFTIDLPASGAWGQSAYQMKWQGGQAPLVQVPTESSLSSMEMNSGARSFLGQNIRTAILILVAVILQILFYLYVAGRAGAAARRNVRLRKQGIPCASPARYRLVRNPGSKRITRLKILSVLLAIVALCSIAGCVLLLYIWRSEFAAIDQTMVFWYGTLYLLPFAFTMLFSGVPALLAGLHTLFWRGGEYRLRSARLFAVSAMVFTVLQLFINLTDINNPPNPIVVGLSLLQLVLLLLVLLIGRTCIKGEILLAAAPDNTKTTLAV